MSFQYNLGSDTLCCVQDSYLFYLFASIQLWASFKCNFQAENNYKELWLCVDLEGTGGQKHQEHYRLVP